MDTNEIDTTNKFFVSLQAGHVVVMKQPMQRLTPDDARLFAAYLVMMAETAELLDPTSKSKFEKVLDAVRNT